MESKYHLRKIRYYDELINEKLQDLQTIRTLAEKVSYSFDLVNVKSSNNDKLPNAIIRIIEMENYLNNLIDDYIDLKTEVIQNIDMINDNTCKLILLYRYIHYMRWDKICLVMNYSYPQICRLHSKALYLYDMIQKDTSKSNIM